MSSSPLGRIVEIAEEGRHLAKNRGFLTIASSGVEIGRVPLDDLAAVLATALSTTASCALLAELAGRGIAFVVCGRNYAPAALLWPIEGHYAQQRRMESQLKVSRPLSKRLWAMIVAAKIHRQGWALAMIGQPAGAFANLGRRVRAGDPDNIEAQAARRYWPLMFGDRFRRNPDEEGPNALLNYGYAILRASTARAIAAAGLHPGMGIFHRHPNNAMPLADDLMEPFRPLVDLRVLKLVRLGIREVTGAAKQDLAAFLIQEELTTSGHSSVSTCLVRLAQTLAESYSSGEPILDLPIVRLPRDVPEIEPGVCGNAPE